MKSLEEKRKYRREYMRKYNATEKGSAINQSHVKTWRKRNPKRPRGRRHGQTWNTYKEIIINFLVERDGDICMLCKNALGDTPPSLDHIIPVAAGGEHMMNNIQLAHPVCNYSRGPQIRKEVLGY